MIFLSHLKSKQTNGRTNNICPKNAYLLLQYHSVKVVMVGQLKNINNWEGNLPLAIISSGRNISSLQI